MSTQANVALAVQTVPAIEALATAHQAAKRAYDEAVNASALVSAALEQAQKALHQAETVLEQAAQQHAEVLEQASTR